MILAMAATEMEMQPFLRHCAERSLACHTLVTGVGPLEAAVRLAAFIYRLTEDIRAVINFGVAGAYLQPSGRSQPQLLDLCLATSEVFGDLGLAYPDRVESLPPQLVGESCLHLDRRLRQKACEILGRRQREFLAGAFVTVASASATAARGRMLQGRWDGLCENMEGAAVARVCREFSLPMLEVRVISNHVEDRDPRNWRLPEACERAAEGAALLLQGLLS